MVDRIAEMRVGLSPRQRSLLRFVEFALSPIISISTILGCAAPSASKEPSQPKNFYNYHILIEKQEDMGVYVRFPYTLRLFTNDEPRLTRVGDQYQLDATNVYCPRELQRISNELFTPINVHELLGCQEFAPRLQVLSSRSIMILTQPEK